MATDIGKTIEGVPQATAPQGQDPGKFQQVMEVLMQPENIMTAIVLGSALLQPKRAGESSLAAGARGLVGSLGFRNQLDVTQEKREQTAAEGKRREQALKDEAEFRRGQLGIGREQVEATRQNTAADERAQRAQVELQYLMNQEDNIARRAEAEMAMNAQLEAARIAAGAKTDPGADFTKLLYSSAIGIMEAEAAAGRPVPTFPDALIMATKLLPVSQGKVQVGARPPPKPPLPPGWRDQDIPVRPGKPAASATKPQPGKPAQPTAGSHPVGKAIASAIPSANDYAQFYNKYLDLPTLLQGLKE
jgi:hypothetical protein